MDIFDQRAAVDESEGQYGLSGEMKKTQYVLQLLGAPWCPDTLKCILIAAEQGMEMTCGVIDASQNEHQSSDYLAVSEFGLMPALKESDYYTSGVKAITEFINARGLGTTLIPMNDALATDQECWIQIARTQAEPAINTLVKESICSDNNDAGKIDSAKSTLSPILDQLNDALGKSKYVVGKNFSLADIHWAADLHLLSLTAGADLVNQRSNIKSWLDGLRNKKSACGQDIIAMSFLPSADDIKAKKMVGIVKIPDF